MERGRSSSSFADQRPFPDVILRSQFFEMVGKRSLSSEQRLMLAVLADAINVVQDCAGSANQRQRSSFGEAAKRQVRVIIPNRSSRRTGSFDSVRLRSG